MILAADELDVAHIYKLLIATIVPRPIGWVSTLSVEGVANLAPFSFFTVVGRKPPVLSLSMQRRSDGVTRKDSFVNIRDTG
jgi:flavin reductase (DIM6/NTAB) family NADH-FMN oxidoreductase RutF